MNYKTPKKPNKKGASINLEMLAEAVLELGLEKDLVIKWSNGIHCRGAWRPKDYIEQPVIYYAGQRIAETPIKNRDFSHSITISTHANPEDAERHLWHELTHAAQAERFDCLEDFLETYKGFQRAYGYAQNPMEDEANAAAILRPFDIINGHNREETEEEKEEAKEKLERAVQMINRRLT